MIADVVRLFVCYEWSSLAFTVEHAAHLAAVTSLAAGAAYLLASILLGWGVYLFAHRWGRRW